MAIRAATKPQIMLGESFSDSCCNKFAQVASTSKRTVAFPTFVPVFSVAMSLADICIDANAEVDRVFAKLLIAGSTFAEADLRFKEADIAFAQEKAKFNEAKNAYEVTRSEVIAAKVKHSEAKQAMASDETNKRQRDT